MKLTENSAFQKSELLDFYSPCSDNNCGVYTPLSRESRRYFRRHPLSTSWARWRRRKELAENIEDAAGDEGGWVRKWELDKLVAYVSGK